MYVSKKTLAKVGKFGIYFIYAVSGIVMTYTGVTLAMEASKECVKVLEGKDGTSK